MGISSALSIGSATPGVCTSTTRPTNPFEGQMIYVTDTDQVLVWNGSAWYANWNLPWGYLTHSTLSANTSLTASNPTTLFNISHTHVNNRRLRISGNFSCTISSATNTACRIQVGGTTVCYLDSVSQLYPAYVFVGYATSTGSSQSFKVDLLYGSVPSTVSVNSSGLAQLIIEDIGPV